MYIRRTQFCFLPENARFVIDIYITKIPRRTQPNQLRTDAGCFYSILRQIVTVARHSSTQIITPQVSAKLIQQLMMNILCCVLW